MMSADLTKFPFSLPNTWNWGCDSIVSFFLHSSKKTFSMIYYTQKLCLP